MLEFQCEKTNVEWTCSLEQSSTQPLPFIYYEQKTSVWCGRSLRSLGFATNQYTVEFGVKTNWACVLTLLVV